MLDELILEELQLIDLKGIIVLSIKCGGTAIRVLFKVDRPDTDIDVAEIEFEVNDNYQVNIFGATHEGTFHDNPNYLFQFENIVFDVMTKVKVVEKRMRQEYGLLLAQMEKKPFIINPVEQARWEAVLRHEEVVLKQEAELDAKEEELRLLEILLQGKEFANALLRSEEEENLEAKRLENREKLGNSVRKHLGRFRK